MTKPSDYTSWCRLLGFWGLLMITILSEKRPLFTFSLYRCCDVCSQNFLLLYWIHFSTSEMFPVPLTTTRTQSMIDLNLWLNSWSFLLMKFCSFSLQTKLCSLRPKSSSVHGTFLLCKFCCFIFRWSSRKGFLLMSLPWRFVLVQLLLSRSVNHHSGSKGPEGLMQSNGGFDLSLL